MSRCPLCGVQTDAHACSTIPRDADAIVFTNGAGVLLAIELEQRGLKVARVVRRASRTPTEPAIGAAKVERGHPDYFDALCPDVKGEP